MATAMLKQPSPDDAMHGAGFRSFWKRSSRSEATSSSQDSSGGEKTSRANRTLGTSSPSSDDKKESSAPSEAQKRRQQVYQAQKRHRNRKAEYISSLEAELARLRHADAEVNSEKDALEQQNQAMRDLLASQSINAQLDSISLSSQAPSVGSFGGMVNMHFDEQAASDRWFVEYLDSESMQWTSSDTSGSEGLDASPQTPINGDSWAALDFILALEHPCRDHVHHPMINPEAWLPEPGSGHGHAMTTTAAVFAGALPFEGVVNKANQYVLPHTEIDKLVELSQKLDFDDTDLTPAQAYSAVRQSVPNDAFLKPVLELLKQPLAKLVHCAHFGSLMDALQFWEHFDASVQSLRFTRPELEASEP